MRGSILAMNLTDFEAFVTNIEPDGLACLTALAIKSPQPISDLCRIVRLGERKVKEIMLRLDRFGYAGPVDPLDGSKWHITDKAKAMLFGLFQNILGHGSNPRQALLTSTGSNPDQLACGGSDPANLGYVARGAQPPLIHSDQIIDQSNSDFDHESEMNETPHPPRDTQSVAAALDRYGIRDLPGKPNRATLQADVWVTAERIGAAIERARVNPLRKSPNPIGLAVAELLRHRPEIDEWIAQHLAGEPVGPTSQPVIDERSAAIASARAEIKRIEDAMNVATWDEHHRLSTDRQKAYAVLHNLIEVTA
jgi:hypothetical protein